MTGTGLDGLNGTQKAAMFMLAAGEESASKLFAKLDLEEIRDITQAMSRLGRVSGDTVEALLSDFLERLGGTAGLVGGYHAAKRLLGRSLSADKVDASWMTSGGRPGARSGTSLPTSTKASSPLISRMNTPRPSL